MQWFNRTPEEALEKLQSNADNGLSTSTVQNRLTEYGGNELNQAEGASPIKIFLEQLKNPLIFILAIGAILSFYTGHMVDAIAITIIIFINASISFTQEYKAQKSIDALKDMAAPKCTAKRDGDWMEIPARELVPGDIVKLATGNIIPADARLIEAVQLQVDEAALTGESEPVHKEINALNKEDITLGDQINMVFMSTAITNGNGLAMVTGTGMNTEVGKIANMMATTETRMTPLQKRIHDLSKTLIWAALGIVAFIVGLGIYDGMGLTEMVNTGISLAVAAIPEGLPTVVTIVLTLGAKSMMKNKALAKQLASVETLGSTSVICSDKTGTLTQNKMQTVKLWAAGESYNVDGIGYEPRGTFTDNNHHEITPKHHFHLMDMLEMSALCSDTLLYEKDGQYHIQGVPTEGAIVVAAAKVGATKEGLLENNKLVASFPFDSKRKMMSVIIQDADGDYKLIVKGAPDVILANAKVIEYEDKHLDIVSNQTIVNDVIEEFGNQALRTLAIAYRPLREDEITLPQEELEQCLILSGIHGIIDPPRPEATLAVKECDSAGVRVVMITGDHALTAKAIAKQMGIIDGDDAIVMTGAELNDTSDEELIKLAPQVSVFARVAPEHKLRIVNALQTQGEVVAMTGDGVNDSPALRKADIGIAMGITGTGVARESADLILLDDNFATIVTAVREGRRIYDNIRKFIRQGLTANVSEVSAILFAFLLMTGEPLLTLVPLMILWINLVSDGIPALALGVDEAEDDVMKRKPRPRDESFFADNLNSRIITRGLVMGALTFSMFQFALNQGASLEYAQTLAFMTLIFGQLFHVFDARTFTTIYHRDPFSNKMLLLAVAGSATLSIIMVYLPLGNLALGTTPLEFNHLIMVVFIAALPTFILSGLKEIFQIKWL